MRSDTSDAGAHRKRNGGTGRKRFVLMAYAVWVAAVLLTSVPYLAETGTRKVVDDGEYTYSPMFPHDGDIEHYEVEREDSDMNASIFLEYHADKKTVDIEAVNIAELEVDCKSIARKHSVELTNDEYADTQLVHQYFYDMGHIVVNTVVTDTEGMTVTFKDMPVPTAVVADSEEYTEPWATSGNIQVEVPEGEHTYILYFTGAPEYPTAVIAVDREIIVLGMEVEFDGTGSIAGEGPQGAIQDYMWDLDDSDELVIDSDEAKFSHEFEKSGTFTVSLTVRNGYWLKHTATVDITVKKTDDSIDLDKDGIANEDDPDIDGDEVLNDDDDFPDDPGAYLDTDGDGLPDNLTGVSTTGLIADDDDDDDGVPDLEDEDPIDATVGRAAKSKPAEESTLLPILIVVIVIIVVALVAVVAMAKSKATKRKAAEEAAAQQAAAAAAAQQAAAEQAAAEQAAAQQAAAQQAEAPPEGYDGYGGYDAYGGAEGAALAGGQTPALTEGEMPPGEAGAEPGAPGAAEAAPEMARDEYMAEVDNVAVEEFGFSDDELSSLHEAIDETVAAEAAAPVAGAAEATEVVDAAETAAKVATEVPPQQ